MLSTTSSGGMRPHIARRLLGACLTLAIAGSLLTLPARATGPAVEVPTSGVWFRCQTQPLTWSLYIAPGTRLKAATERRLITRALGKVTAASNGAYTFAYVPTKGTPHVEWDPSRPIAWQLPRPAYVSTPRVDVLFMVTDKGQPTLTESDGSFPFLPGGQFRAIRGSEYYTSEFATTVIAFTAHAQGYLEASTMERSSVRDREGIYLWSAASAVGSDLVQVSRTLSPAARGEIAELAQLSCNALAAYPDARPSVSAGARD